MPLHHPAEKLIAQGFIVVFRNVGFVDALISVIVPVYNAEHYLPYCLEAITAQSWQNLEIILIDDGSSDASARLCDQFAASDARARVIHQKHSGLWAARNRGMEESTGVYLFFPDADDYFHKDMLRMLCKAINLGGIEYPLAICGYKKTERMDEDTDSPVRSAFSVLSQDELFSSIFGRGSKEMQWDKLYRTSCITGMRSRDYERAQDLDFNMRLYSVISSAVLVDADLYYWVQHPSSLTKQADSLQKTYDCTVRMAYRNYMELPQDKRRSIGHYLLHFLFKRMLLYKNYVMDSGNKEEVFSLCRKYRKDTINDYLSCGHFGLYKYLVAFLNYTPHLARVLIKTSGN